MIKFEADPVLGYKDKEALYKLTEGVTVLASLEV
jgi:hypothetical protein